MLKCPGLVDSTLASASNGKEATSEQGCAAGGESPFWKASPWA